MEHIDVEARERVAKLEGRYEGHDIMLSRIHDRVDFAIEKINNLPEILLTKEEARLNWEKHEVVHENIIQQTADLKAARSSVWSKTKSAISDMPKSQKVLVLLSLVGAATLTAAVASEVKSTGSGGVLYTILKYLLGG